MGTIEQNAQNHILSAASLYKQLKCILIYTPKTILHAKKS